jgi:hypothetical protein
VPVTSRNEETEGGGSAPPQEKALRQRIYLSFVEKKLGIGDVRVYVLDSNLTPVYSLGIDVAQDSARLQKWLLDIVTILKATPGPPPIKPHATSRPLATVPADSLALHLVSRSKAPGSWHEFPAENWIVLNRAETLQLLPEAAPKPGAVWTLPKPVALKLAEWVYPQNEEKTGVNRSRVDIADFKVTAVAVEGPLVRARIDGKIKLLHTFYPNSAAQDFAESQLLGYIDFNAAEKRVQRLRLATTRATYVGTEFTTSLISKSKETLEALTN